MEFDTYRDPAGPLSASAQVLFGAIANFVTGLADVPTEMVLDLVSAGRALGNPQEPLDPHAQCKRMKWRVPRAHREDELESEEDSMEERTDSEPQSAQRSLANSSEDQEDQDDNGNNGEDDEKEEESRSSDDSGVHGVRSNSGLERKRTLELAKTQTMSSEISPAKQRGVFTEAVFQGSRMSKKLINLVIWLPTDLSMSLSKGFHNAPKLYHDTMVKSTPKVIGFRSGFRAAGKVHITPFPNRK